MTKEQARVNLSPSIQSAKVAIATATPGKTDIPTDLWLEHIEEIESAIARIRTGDLSDLEASLYSQIKALEKQFFKFSELAAQLYPLNPAAGERAFNMALKAQKQCRQTIATLNELKNPKRATFIKKQQNLLMAQHDQAQPTQHNAQMRSLNPSQQQEVDFNAQMDTRGEREAVPVDPQVEAVAAQHRAAN